MLCSEGVRKYSKEPPQIASHHQLVGRDQGGGGVGIKFIMYHFYCLDLLSRAPDGML